MSKNIDEITSEILLSKKIDITLSYQKIKRIKTDMQLTKAEEQVMQILWTLGEATVQDIREKFEDSKPARTTIATILSILETKNFVMHKVDGRSNIYRALVSKEDYSKGQLFGFLKNYFNSSFSSMASFFAKEANLTVEDMDKLLEETRKELENEQESTGKVQE